MPVSSLSFEEKKLIAEQMDANFKANMERLVAENIQLKSDLRLMSDFDPAKYRELLAEVKDLRAKLREIVDLINAHCD